MPNSRKEDFKLMPTVYLHKNKTSEQHKQRQ